MLIKTEQQSIDVYFADTDHASQSGIKKLLRGVDAYLKADEKKMYYEEKGHFIIGSGVDIMLTQGDEEFDDEFFIGTDDKPSGKTLSILHNIFDTFTEDMTQRFINRLRFSHILDNTILEVAGNHEYQKRWSNDSVLKSIRKQADYFNQLCMSNGKQIITLEDYELMSRIASSFQQSKWSYLFDDTHSSKNVDIYYQLPIYSTINGIKTKALLDIVLVDHKAKLIIPFDIKTTGFPVKDFHYSAKKFRYDIQASWYIEHLRHWKELNPIISNYEISRFNFLIESSINPKNTCLFHCSSEFISIGKSGRKTVYGAKYNENNVLNVHTEIQKEVYGWEYALELFNWHLENGFEIDREIKNNNYIFKLEWK